jgi:transposase InsO family protein
MDLMGIDALYRKKRTSKRNPEHPVFPYLHRNLVIDRPNQVWSADITYIPMRHGFLYLFAVLDWSTRKVLAWRLSSSLTTDFCIDAVEQAIATFGHPEIFNSDQGSQFTDKDFVDMLNEHRIEMSMDGKGAWRDNVFIERFWRSLKYEEVYLRRTRAPRRPSTSSGVTSRSTTSSGRIRRSTVNHRMRHSSISRPTGRRNRRGHHIAAADFVSEKPAPPLTTTDRGTMTIGWGPNGHPVQVQNYRYGGGTGTAYPDMTLHWDGDTLLFVTDASGNVMSFKVGLDGETGPGNQNGMFVYDRDTAGVLLMTSNATGHGGITPLDPGDLTGPSLPSSYGYTANTPLGFGLFSFTRSDGFNIGPIRISGVRAFNPELGSWTTPDAYEGDIHDPASQQRYMWNRNNPYEYSDPSGFYPGELGDASNHPYSWQGMQVAMDSSARPAPSDIVNAVRDAVDRTLRAVARNGADLRSTLEKEVNSAVGKVEGGKYRVSWYASNKAGFQELRNSTSTLRIYESTTHGGLGDGGINIKYNMNPGRMGDRMGWDSRLGSAWSTYGRSDFGAPRLPFVPVGFGKDLQE